MDYLLNEKERRLIGTVRDYAEEHFSRASIRQWMRDEGLPDQVVRDFVSLDFGDFNIVEAKDGGHFDYFGQTLVLEELARCSGATLPFQNDFLNLSIMEAFANDDQLKFVIDSYRKTGRLAFALAFTEPEAGSDSMSMKASVRTVDGVPVLNGSKTFVNNGEYAPFLLVGAIDEDDQTPRRHPALSFWLVPRDLPGIMAYPIRKIGQSIMPFSDVIFSGVKLRPEYRLSGGASGFPQLFHIFESGRLFVCATSLGLAQAAYEIALDHARTRTAFGSPIGSFQMVQEKIVDMEVKLRTMRMMVYQTAWGLERGKADRLDVALMKRHVPKTATEVASDAMQILGGRGYTEQTLVSSIWQDCRGMQIAEGTDEIMVHIAAPLLLKSSR